MWGYALYAAQKGGKHDDAKVLKGFGDAGVIEVIPGSTAIPSARSTRCASPARYMRCMPFRRRPSAASRRPRQRPISYTSA
jgi:hypothetical protein